MTTELVARATQILLERTAHAVGVEFFRALVRGLAETLGTRYALIAEVTEAGGDRVRTLAIWRGDQHGENFSYDLAGTPCAHVFGHGLCHYPRAVAEQFPEDTMLTELGIQSYLGLPVNGPSGKRLGLLAALHDAPTEPVAELSHVLALFADRAGTELERLHFEGELARSEARYRQIVSTCVEGVWTIDTEARTTFVNPQMAAMLGRAPADMLGHKITEFMDDEGRATTARNLVRRRDGVAEHHEFRLVHADGHDVWTVMATNPLYDEAGVYSGALALVTDITEKRALEASRVKARNLESLGVLAGGVAHDFNNLLVGVLANADLAAMELDREAPDLALLRPALDDIKIAALRAADLIRQLLAFSGKGRFTLTRVDLNALVTDMVRLVAKRATPDTRIRFSPGPPAFVEGDAGQLSQVVMNLVLNASEALTEPGGQVTVATTNVLADRAFLADTPELEPGTYACLEVTDTGVGMDEDTLSRIFEPFYTTKFTGRGLGLAAVLGVVRGHHGAIRVRSSVGHGTSFRVLLPCASPPVTVPAPPSAHPSSSRPSRSSILVVDDEPLIRGVLRKLLELGGFAVLEAVDGADAVAQFRAREAEIALVLLDMTMPGLSGDQVFDALAAIRPGVKVVVSSGYAEEQTLARFAGRRLAGFLQKPWKPSDVDEVVARALSGDATRRVGGAT